ncbi:MAG: TetR/AcrR family transcriptional regulator [Actinobacteria bacterium]|nr:TetR/AcrR family transcriptional regulator [Actinomycetota bacterium]
MHRDSVTNHNIVTDYREERLRGREALRRGLLDVAGRLLVEEGPGALSMRRISRQVNCSTKVLYTLFGGKRELVEELWLEGFDRLCRSAEGHGSRRGEPGAGRASEGGRAEGVRGGHEGIGGGIPHWRKTGR